MTVTTNRHHDRRRHDRAEPPAHAVRVVRAGRRQSDSGRARQGLLFLDAGREALSRLQQPVDVRQHRPWRRARHRARSRSRRRRLPTRTRSWPRSRARGWARSSPRSRPATSTCSSSPTAARKRTRTRSRSRALYTGRHKILARYRSYHGGTAGAIALTGDPRRWAAEPGMPGVIHVLDPYHGIQRGWDTAEQSLAMIEEIIQLEGPQTIAAFFLEPVTRHQRHPGSARRLSRRACAISARSTAS